MSVSEERASYTAHPCNGQVRFRGMGGMRHVEGEDAAHTGFLS